MKPLIEVVNLKKYFKTSRGLLHAVDGVDFSIEQGSTLGVVGESGCGKSTLGRVCVHLLEKTDGQIFYDGRDISNTTKADLFSLRNEMQMIFQDPYSSLNPRMTVSEIIAEPLIIYKRFHNKAALRERVANLMDKVGLAERVGDSYPHELDGGRRQRIGVARALALEPRFIVCDEPVSALDVSIQAQILNLLMDLQQELQLTYLFITHNLSVVKHISRNICVMYLGCLVEYCPTESLFAEPLHPYTMALLSAIPTISIHAPRNRVLLQGEVTSPIEPPDCCRFAPRCQYAEEICFHKQPELEQMDGNHFVACHLVRKIHQKNTLN